MTPTPRLIPERADMQTAMIAAAQRHGSQLPVWLASDLLDVYGRDNAERIADALPGMIRKEHDARVRGASLRTRPDMAQIDDAADRADAIRWLSMSKAYLADHRPMPAFEPAPPSMWRRYAVTAALVFALVATAVYAATAAVDATTAATARQIEAGAVEW